MCGLVRRNHGHAPLDQLAGESRRPVAMIFGIAIFNRDILALDKPRLFQSLAKSSSKMRRVRGRRHAQESDHRVRLLGARGERPYAQRASQQRRGEVTPFHRRALPSVLFHAPRRDIGVLDYENACMQARFETRWRRVLRRQGLPKRVDESLRTSRKAKPRDGSPFHLLSHLVVIYSKPKAKSPM